MKVLTLQEPYASFIQLGYKKIETRSWKTNYRGEIYIHAGKSKSFLNSSDEYTKKLTKEINLNYGNIICVAELVDCIEMTDSFIENIKQKNQKEYKLGIYENGRYAWVFKNVRSLENPIPAKGKLNIWNYEEENKVKKLTLS